MGIDRIHRLVEHNWYDTTVTISGEPARLLPDYRSHRRKSNSEQQVRRSILLNNAERKTAALGRAPRGK